MASPLCHFEFLSDDPEKSRRFYSTVFGWKYDDSSMPGYTLIDTGSEPGGGLMKRPEQAPGVVLNVYFLVDDMRKTLDTIKASGGMVLVDQTEIPNVGWWAFAADPEGIPFGIYKSAQG